MQPLVHAVQDLWRVGHIEQHVRQQRRQRPALRRAFVPLPHDPGHHHTSFEVAVDEP